MANGLKATKPNVLSALGTYTHTTTASGLYTVEARVNVPPSSSLVITITQNGTTKATSTAPTPHQKEVDLRITLNCAQSDVLNIVLTSSAPVDQQPIALKGTGIVRQGL